MAIQPPYELLNTLANIRSRQASDLSGALQSIGGSIGQGLAARGEQARQADRERLARLSALIPGLQSGTYAPPTTSYAGGAPGVDPNQSAAAALLGASGPAGVAAAGAPSAGGAPTPALPPGASTTTTPGGWSWPGVPAQSVFDLLKLGAAPEGMRYVAPSVLNSEERLLLEDMRQRGATARETSRETSAGQRVAAQQAGAKERAEIMANARKAIFNMGVSFKQDMAGGDPKTLAQYLVNHPGAPLSLVAKTDAQKGRVTAEFSKLSNEDLAPRETAFIQQASAAKATGGSQWQSFLDSMGLRPGAAGDTTAPAPAAPQGSAPAPDSKPAAAAQRYADPAKAQAIANEYRAGRITREEAAKQLDGLLKQ